MMKTPALALQGINHLARQTRCLDESREFYVRVLGAQEITRPNFSFAGAWLYLAGIQIHLIVDDGARTPVEGIYTREDHFAFATGDIDEMERRLQAHGVRYERKAIPERGWPQLFFRDPDGHLIEVGTYGRIDQ